jgi:putative glycosyltransferase (TIGR04372 family)
LRRLLRLKPDDVGALIDLATLHAEIGHIKMALHYSDRGVEVAPDHLRTKLLNKKLKDHLFKLHLDVINQVVPDEIGRGKQKVIVPLRLLGRLGHIIVEPFILKCLYDPEVYDIIFVIPPRETAVSLPVFDIFFRDLFYVEEAQNSSEAAYNLHNKSVGTYQYDDRIIVLETISDLIVQAVEKAPGGQVPYRAYLTESEMVEGKKLRAEIGIPTGAKIVTLYVRDEGFLSGVGAHGIRNSSIVNYIPSIQYLIDEGYYVVRIGDDKMPRLPDLGSHVIDAPFHDAYTQLFEPYFVSQSDFMLKTLSGPEALSFVFGVPSLLVNAYVTPIYPTTKSDLSIFRSYYSHRYERNLSFQEIGYDKDILFSNSTDSFVKNQIDLRENTASDILNSTKEMVARLHGSYESTPSIDERFGELCRQIHGDLSLDTSDIIYADLEVFSFVPHLMNAKISHEFCKSHPEFLDQH